jgi:hypothetical protein
MRATPNGAQRNRAKVAREVSWDASICGRFFVSRVFAIAGFGGSGVGYLANCAARRAVIPSPRQRAEGDSMWPKERRESGQNDLFRARLDQIVDLGHSLAKLARAVDCGFSRIGSGRSIPTRLGIHRCRHGSRRAWRSSSRCMISRTRRCASAGSRTRTSVVLRRGFFHE